MSSKKEKETPIQEELRLKAFAQVKYANKALSLWETLISAYPDNMSPEIKDAFIRVRNYFIEKELKAYRHLFTLIASRAITDTEDLKVAKMALKRFLSADMSVIHFWTHDGEFPGSWLMEDEKKIRDCFRDLAQDLVGKRKYTKKAGSNRTDQESINKELKSNLRKLPPVRKKKKPEPIKPTVLAKKNPIKKNVRSDIVREKPVKKAKK